MYIVYRVSGPNTDQAYYGYVEGEDLTRAKETFMAGIHRADSADRGDYRLFESNNSDEDSLVFEVLEAFNDEVEAWMSRNDYRSTQVDTITGPTMFPGNVAERARKASPIKFAKWKSMTKSTAKEAYADGAWTFQAIKDLCAVSGKKQVTFDLEKLTPQQFTQKYF